MINKGNSSKEYMIKYSKEERDKGSGKYRKRKIKEDRARLKVI